MRHAYRCIERLGVIDSGERKELKGPLQVFGKSSSLPAPLRHISGM